jgi:predicted secreted protein
MRLIPSLALLLGASLASPAAAGDAAALRVIGFSPDGTIFAFEQYTMIYEEEAAFSEYVFVDTRTDRYLPDTPIKILLRDDDGNDETKAREQAAAKAAPLIAQHKVEQPGTRHEGKASMALDEIGIYQMSPGPLAKAQAFALPDGRKARLTVSQRALGKADCDGAGGRGVKGKVAVAGLRLTLVLDGKPTVLQEDRKLPVSRRCVSAYGIAEAYLHAAPDGAVTIAAIIETVDNHDYHAGPNRRFMAVTRRLAPK